MRNYFMPWYQTAPLTKQQQEAEIASSLVVSKQDEFSKEDIQATLKALNLSSRFPNPEEKTDA